MVFVVAGVLEQSPKGLLPERAGCLLVARADNSDFPLLPIDVGKGHCVVILAKISDWSCTNEIQLSLADIHLSYMSREMQPALKFHLNLLRIPRIHLVGVFIA